MANRKGGKSATVLPPLNHVLRSQLEKSSSSVSDISDMSQESQLLLDLILGKLDEHKTEIIAKLDEKDALIDELKRDNSSLKLRVKSLELQMEDVVSHSRSAEILVDGDKLPAASVGENPTNIICSTFKSELNYEINLNNIISARRMGQKAGTQGPDRRRILLRLRNAEDKKDLIECCKRVKPQGLYINESLTPMRSKILYFMRLARKKYPD